MIVFGFKSPEGDLKPNPFSRGGGGGSPNGFLENKRPARPSLPTKVEGSSLTK